MTKMTSKLYLLGLTLCLALAGTAAQAHEAELPATQGQAPFELFYQDLGVFVSGPGETRDQMLARAGAFLADFTKRTGWEACGQIQEAQEGTGWAVNLLTSGSQIGCVQVPYDMRGYTDTGVGIHSHPAKSSVRLSVQDQKIRPGKACGSYMRVFPMTFSPTDYTFGPSYLVVPGGMMSAPKLLYQDGVGTERVVARLDDAATAPDGPVRGVARAPQAGVVLVASAMERVPVKLGVLTCKAF